MPSYEKGTYRATIVGQGFPEPSEYGLQYAIELEIGVSKDRRTSYLSLTDADGNRAEYADASIKVLRYLGFCESEADFAQLDPDHSEHHSFIGKVVDAYCSPKVKDSKTSERWYINTPGAGTAIKPLEKSSIRKLNALFGKEIKAPADSPPPVTAPKAAPPVEQLPAEMPAGNPAKDIPF